MTTAICPEGHLSDTTDRCDQCGAPIATQDLSTVLASVWAEPPETPAPPAPGGPSEEAAPAPARAVPGGKLKICPSCGAPNVARDRFCSACGHELALGARGAAQARIAQKVAATAAEVADPPPTPEGEVRSRSSNRADPDFVPPSAEAPSPLDDRPAPPRTWSVVAAADRDYFARRGSPGATFPEEAAGHRFALTTNRCVIGRGSPDAARQPEIDLSGPPEDPGIAPLHVVLLGSPEGGWRLLDPGSGGGTFLNDSPEPVRLNVAVTLSPGDRIHVGAWTTLTLQAEETP